MKTLALAFAALLTGAAPMPAFAQTPAAATDAAVTRMDHVSIQAIGAGDSVILIPGLASPRAVWDGIAPELAEEHRVLLVQVNGFAGDDPGANLKPGVLAGIVGDLVGYMDAQGIERASVIGHSMGGLAGLLLARDHGERVERLMVVDALPFIGPIFAPGATVAMLEPQARAMRDRLAASHGKPADPTIAKATAERFALTPEARAKVAAWSQAADPRVVGQAMYEDMTTDLRSDMAGIATPITLIYAWDGAAVPKARTEALYRNAYKDASDVTFVDVGDSRHFVMLDQPEVFAGAVRAFLGE